MIKDLRPLDIIAGIVLIACFVLVYFQKDGFVTTTISAIIGYYFGHKKIENNFYKNERTINSNN